ncbi:hypothetical protein EVAR_76015_1 [Eumeta japonica]|uniref:Uncharacterized protein n=1 Tax=Eumeta variegata TaxID=151549 RepID=A0A4C1UAA0_EUMVA|nr:hypothetical protein EVAR_76015_1 [Eumeta japonica]
MTKRLTSYTSKAEFIRVINKTSINQQRKKNLVACKVGIRAKVLRDNDFECKSSVHTQKRHTKSSAESRQRGHNALPRQGPGDCPPPSRARAANKWTPGCCVHSLE